jgi:hypothetical protein
MRSLRMAYLWANEAQSRCLSSPRTVTANAALRYHAVSLVSLTRRID